MELKPNKNSILLAMDKRSEYLNFIFATITILAINILLLCFGKYKVTSIVLIIACSIDIYLCYKLYDKNKKRVTDITNSYIRLEDDYISCQQTADDQYEKCDILLNEIDLIIEDQKDIGFYIGLKNERNLSTIEVDGIKVDRSVFYINGYIYDLNDFIQLYEQFLARSKDSNIKAYKKHLSWTKESYQKEWLLILSPWIISLLIIAIHIVMTLFLVGLK